MKYKEMWVALGLSENNDIGVDFALAYDEPHRHYHTQQHLKECMVLLDKFEDKFSRPAEVKLALYFHDIIYDPKSNTNEIESAARAVNFLRSINAPDTLQQRIHDLVMMTATHTPPFMDYDAYLMKDIDLAILGSGPDRFKEYQAQIRKEFKHVDTHAFIQARNEFLKKFLDYDTIFNTRYFRGHYEVTARKNIKQLIQETTYE
jgi:predicted metal-dependent HD superfamily phosphohydrolase